MITSWTTCSGESDVAELITGERGSGLMWTEVEDSDHLPVQVCITLCVVYLQVHRGDVGPDGLRELPAGLPVCHGSQKQAARHQMAAPVLHLHRQEVRRFHSPGRWGVESVPLNLVSMTTQVWFVLSRLKKDLKGLLVVHPAWYIRALITVVKPFIRSVAHTPVHLGYHNNREPES